MKGLVLYAGKSAECFPHSLEFSYLPLAKLLTGPGQYTWHPLDDKLGAISGRSCQAVFRIWLEFPGQASELPDYPAAPENSGLAGTAHRAFGSGTFET